MSLFTEPRMVELHGLRFEIAGISEQGPRSENQDALLIDAFPRAGLVAVADGMGGERGGRLAADTALRSLVESGPLHSLDDARRAVRAADAAVTGAAALNPEEHGGMGCALGLLALTARRDDGRVWIAAHVGDVRILSRSPDGVVRLETRDHTPAFARWEAGEISLDEIPDSAGANRLQRAVGRGGEADVGWLPAPAGWTWLIISDGVYKAMRLDELGEAMAIASAAEGCEAIRRKVLERGPDDNFTAVLIRAQGGAGPASTDKTEPMPHVDPAPAGTPARSGVSLVAALLALVALALAGYALWTAREARARAVEPAEVEQLRLRVDSLRDRLSELSDPFGPAVPGDTLTRQPPSGGMR